MSRLGGAVGLTSDDLSAVEIALKASREAIRAEDAVEIVGDEKKL